jgi:hypothetical protein
MATKKAKAVAIAQEHAANQMRTWTFTLAISATLLSIMYGLAFWHEARSEAARVQAIQEAPVSAPTH